MPQISLTTFNDFALAQGAAKLTVVRNALRQYEDNEYDPRTDYWRRLRRHIRQVHMGGGTKSDLDTLTDLPPSKERQYGESLREYKRWWGRKKLEWFDPPAARWSSEELTVRVNPELGLLVNGKPHIVKLYFKKEPIHRRRLAYTLHLLHEQLGREGRSNLVPGVLDVRRHRFVEARPGGRDLEILLHAEARFFCGIWTELARDVAAD